MMISRVIDGVNMGHHLWKRGESQDTALHNILVNFVAALLVLVLIYKGA
jgi:hypothetical protein